MGSLEGRVCVVTGGARGIGEAVARRFVAEGANVVIADVRDELGEALATELGTGAKFCHLDVTSETDWAETVQEAEDRFGKVDGLVNNAGVFEFGALRDYSLERFRRVVDINQTGVFLGMRAVIASMERGGGGTIVNISSVAGLSGVAYGIAYAASKFAVTGMTKSAALELGALGIRVNSVHPGMVATPLVLGDGENEALLPAGRPGGGRLAEPREVANLVLYLTSDESSYSTGAQFVVDDGGSAGQRPPTPPT